MSTLFKKYKAFTFTEVLITLGIIGIVAAMTIPALLNSTKDEELKNMWKKEYSAISQAYLQVKQDHGGDLSEYFDSATNNSILPIINEIGNYLSTLKYCGSTLYTICGIPSVNVQNAYKTLSNGYIEQNDLITEQRVLNDGANFYARAYNQNYALIWIDVNGYAKKPNILGRDLFGITVTKNKIIPMGSIGTGVENTCNTTSKTPSYAYGFTGTGDVAGAGCSMEVLYK